MAIEAGKSGCTPCIEVEGRKMLNPGPLEARAGCTLGAVQAVHLMLREREHCPGEHGGGGGCSLSQIQIGGMSHTTAAFISIVSKIPGQVRGWPGTVWRQEERLP